MATHGQTRRSFLRRAAGVAVSGALRPAQLFGQAPAIISAASARPSSAFGVTAGDVDVDRAIVWSRTDRASRLVVEYATTDSFKDVRRVVGPAALEVSDFTARVDLSGLPAGQRIFYRATFQSLHDLKVWSEPMVGTFTTPQTTGPLRDVMVRLERGHGWSGLGDQRRDGRHAAVRDDAHGGRRCVHPHRRHHLRRRPAGG